jgi:hypothetical protein
MNGWLVSHSRGLVLPLYSRFGRRYIVTFGALMKSICYEPRLYNGRFLINIVFIEDFGR